MLAALPLAAGASGVQVEIRLAAPEALEVSYFLPADCGRLSFDKNGKDGAAIRKTWQALDQCGSADGDALRRNDAACQAVRLRVPLSTAPRPGYAAAFPLGDAVYAHTSNFAVGAQCGPVSYRFIAPHVALQGRLAHGSAEAAGHGKGYPAGDMAVLLSSAPLTVTPEGIRYYAPGLGAANVEQIDKVARGTIAYLKAAMPDAPFAMPVLAAARVSAAGGVGVDGDAADVLRIGLVNWPQQPSDADREQLTLLVSHEFSHRFQVRDAFESYPDERLIHEGGAEFLRWVASVQNGWLSRREAARVLDASLAECLLGTGARNWRAVTPREIGGRRLAYRCGLPAYVYSLAARQEGGTALGRFSGLYRSAQAGNKPDFAQALECGADADAACKARWLPALLQRETPMREAFAGLFAATGLARPAPATAPQRRLMLERAFEELMREDCGGASYYPGEEVVIVDAAGKSCHALKDGMRIRQIEGRALSGDTDAVDAMSRACAQRRQVRLGLEQGGFVDVACSKPYDAAQAFYAVDIDAVLAALELPPAPPNGAAILH